MEKQDILPPRSEDFHTFTVLFTEEAKLFWGETYNLTDHKIARLFKHSLPDLILLGNNILGMNFRTGTYKLC